MLQHTTTEDIAYNEKGEYDKAITDYDKAIRLDLNNAMPYLNRGGIYHTKGNLTGDYARAIEDYDNTVRLCPNYKTAFVDRKFIYGGQASVDKAVKLLNSIVEDYVDSGNKAAAAYYLGVSCLFNGNRNRAREYFEEACQQGFDDRTKVAKHLENLKS